MHLIEGSQESQEGWKSRFSDQMNEIMKKHNSSKVLSKFDGTKWDKHFLKKLLEIKRSSETGVQYCDHADKSKNCNIDKNYFQFMRRVEKEKEPVIKSIMKKFHI